MLNPQFAWLPLVCSNETESKGTDGELSFADYTGICLRLHVLPVLLIKHTVMSIILFLAARIISMSLFALLKQ